MVAQATLTSQTHNLPLAPSPPLPTPTNTSWKVRVARALIVLSSSNFELGVDPLAVLLSSFRFLAVGAELDGWDETSDLSSTGMGYGE